MDYINLGSTGLRISRIAFGAGPVAAVMIGDDTALQERLVRRVLDAGINWFDTAASYGDGRAEAALGNVTTALGATCKVHLATKVRLLEHELSDIGEAVRSSVYASLQRLRSPRVTLLQLHNSITNKRGEEPTSLTPHDILGVGGVLEAFKRLQQDGIVQLIGITAIGQPRPLREIVDSGQFDTIQVPYNLLNPTAGQEVPADFSEANYGNVMSHAARLGMGVFAIRVYAGGALAGNPPSHHALTTKFFPVTLYERDQLRVAKLREMLPANTDVKQLAVQFPLSHAAVTAAIIGFSKPSHVDEALMAMEAGAIPTDLIEKISQFSYR